MYITDISLQSEKHAPKWWKKLHKAKYRAKLKQYIHRLDHEGYSKVPAPQIYKPYIYYW